MPILFEAIRSEGIAHNSHIVGSGGNAAVIDPRRDCDVYLEIADRAEMTAKIYDSITKKILSLDDGVIVCPAHGAGSICRREIADHPFTTTGYEKRTNRQLLMGGRRSSSSASTNHPMSPHTSGKWNDTTGAVHPFLGASRTLIHSELTK